MIDTALDKTFGYSGPVYVWNPHEAFPGESDEILKQEESHEMYEENSEDESDGSELRELSRLYTSQSQFSHDESHFTQYSNDESNFTTSLRFVAYEMAHVSATLLYTVVFHNDTLAS